PVPVLVVRALKRFAEDGVASHVAMPVPSPVIPPTATADAVPAVRPAAVPVRLVATPDDGVPSAPLNNTGAPALPTLTPSAVAIPVRSPETPVAIGSPVALVSVAADGVPRSGVVNAGDVAKTRTPVPVSLEITDASCADVVDANCESGDPVTPHV